MQSPSISQRRGKPSQKGIPLSSILTVTFVVLCLMFFMYVKTLNDMVHRDNIDQQRKPIDKASQKEQELQEQKQQSLSVDTLVLTTKLGDISIKLREDLSEESVDYIRQIIRSGKCPRCNIYRVQDKGGIVQGIVRNPELSSAEIKIPLGNCPADITDEKLKEGNCHGPVMTKGMVGWAGGKSGPDFFINGYQIPATFWGYQHTVWGELTGQQTDAVMKQISELPTKKRGGMAYLLEPLQFTMEIV